MEDSTPDRVYSSRKFVMAILCLVSVFVGGLIGIHWVAFQGLYPTFIGGVLGIAGLYIAGNVSNDFLNNRTKADLEKHKITVETTGNRPELSEADKNHDGE